MRVPANFVSWDPYGYRTGRAIPPGTRLDPADKNRRESRTGPVRYDIRDPSGNRLGVLAGMLLPDRYAVKTAILDHGPFSHPIRIPYSAIIWLHPQFL